MTFPIKTVTSVLQVLIYIITSIASPPIRLNVILVIMSVSTFKSAVVLYDLEDENFRPINRKLVSVIRLDVILVIMSVSTFKTAVILYDLRMRQTP